MWPAKTKNKTSGQGVGLKQRFQCPNASKVWPLHRNWMQARGVAQRALCLEQQRSRVSLQSRKSRNRPPIFWVLCLWLQAKDHHNRPHRDRWISDQFWLIRGQIRSFSLQRERELAAKVHLSLRFPTVNLQRRKEAIRTLLNHLRAKVSKIPAKSTTEASKMPHRMKLRLSICSLQKSTKESICPSLA